MKKLNNKGFSLVELLGCFVILTLILLVGLYSARGTLATTFSNLTGISENEIYDASEMYVMENQVTWINGDGEYTCLTVEQLVEDGYFNYDEVVEYKDRKIKIIRNSNTKVVSQVSLVDNCN